MVKTKRKRTEKTIRLACNSCDHSDIAPSLCKDVRCVGCGRKKKSASLICCNHCWRRLPADLRERFLQDQTCTSDNPHGPTIAEQDVARWLVTNQRTCSEM